MNNLFIKSVLRFNNQFRTNKSVTSIAKFKFTSKFTKDPNFLDSTKFLKDEGLLLYESKDRKFFMLISCSLFAYSAYHAYNWYYGDDLESAHNSYYLAVILGAAFVFYQYKLVKTPERIWMDINGKDAYIDFFNYFAFGNNFTLIENKLFCGHGFFLHKYTKMPVVYYNLNGKKKTFFIKYSNIIEDDILRKLLKGQEFNIKTQDLNVKLSKKSKSHYKI